MGELARVLGAAAAGDLSQAVNLDPEGRPLQGEARRLGGLVNGMVSQLAEAARTRAELREKAEQLALSSRYKSEFLANMSHELRTPLNSLLILARLLADNAGGNLTPKQVEFARTIHSSGAELLSLINDILDLAKIESGTVSLAIAQERFADLADHVERTFRQVAADKGLALRLRLDPSLPPVLETDGKRLRQVLTNLLSNAFKFTARGSVELAIGRAAHEQVAFAVTDTGIGIAPAQQRLIFEAFRQADGATGREYGGTGLGLSISRELASLLGGEIRLRSAPGAGSTFTLVLPLRPRAAGGGAVLPPRPAPLRVELPRGAWPALAGRRVLVVDDDIRNVFALTSTLELQRMQVLHAGSGHEAIERLRERRGIDLVLMDVMMPGLDGLDAIRRLRAEPGAAALPVIAVTAKAMPGDRERCLAAGANDYVPKPVRIEALLDAMQRLMPASPETA